MKPTNGATAALMVALHRARRDGVTPARDVAVAERVVIQALEAEGWTWREIGDAIGVSPTHARRVFIAFG